MPGFIIGNGQSGPGPLANVEFHRSHRWVIHTLGIPASVGGTRTATSAFYRFYAKSLELPSLTLEEETVEGASVRYKFAKKAIWDNITISFYDVFGLYPALREWQKKIWTPERGLGLVNDYVGRPVFLLLDGQGTEQQRFELVGAYPSKISHGELSYASSEIKLLNVVFTFNWAEITLNA